ncbi:ABC transporter permease [Schinkia sp. CFF1]
MHKFKLFSRLVTRALLYRKLPTTVALLAIILGTSIIGGLVNLYYDINEKMGKEFRAYGANILISPANQSEIEIEKVNEISSKVKKNKLVGIAPFQYSVVQLDKKPLVLVGTWLDQMQQVSPYWNVTGDWIKDRSNVKEALIGINIAKKYDLKPGSLIKFTNSTKKDFSLRVKGIVSSGGKEDNQIFANMGLVKDVTDRKSSDIVLLSLLSKEGSDLKKEANRLQSSISDIKISPIKQMEQSEEKMLIKIQKLIRLIGIIIFIITILTVTTTMISMIYERRKEVGLKKALGASNQLLFLEFLAEGMIISIVGSTFGVVAAYYIAQLIGLSVFHEAIAFQNMIVPWTYVLSLIIVAISFFIPVRKIMKVDPAIVLKGN